MKFDRGGMFNCSTLWTVKLRLAFRLLPLSFASSFSTCLFLFLISFPSFP